MEREVEGRKGKWREGKGREGKRERKGWHEQETRLPKLPPSLASAFAFFVELPVPPAPHLVRPGALRYILLYSSRVVVRTINDTNAQARLRHENHDPLLPHTRKRHANVTSN